MPAPAEGTFLQLGDFQSAQKVNAGWILRTEPSKHLQLSFGLSYLRGKGQAFVFCAFVWKWSSRPLFHLPGRSSLLPASHWSGATLGNSREASQFSVTPQWVTWKTCVGPSSLRLSRPLLWPHHRLPLSDQISSFLVPPHVSGQIFWLDSLFYL